jgi:RNA polymerase sigma factor (sigma-70 family)
MRVAARRPASPSRAFDALYRKHSADIYRYALAMLQRQADAEDAVQTTFLNAYRALERGERPRHAGTWLRTIALNVCREQQRRASRRPDEVPLDDDPGDLVLDPETPSIGDVLGALSHLPFNQRAALVMREFEGRSMAEIASALEVSPSAVETLLFRARRALREQLGETISCGQAEEAISAQLDGAVPRDRRGPLRAHLRECDACASLARRMRAQRSAVRSLALIPIPASLGLFKFGGGASAGASAGAGTGVTAIAGAPAGGSVLAGATGSLAIKLGVAAVVGATAFGAGYASLHHTNSRPAVSPRHASTAEDVSGSGGVTANAAGRETTVGEGSVSAATGGAHGVTGTTAAKTRGSGAATRSRHGNAEGGAAATGHGRDVGQSHGTGAAAGAEGATGSGAATATAAPGQGVAAGRKHQPSSGSKAQGLGPGGRGAANGTTNGQTHITTGSSNGKANGTSHGGSTLGGPTGNANGASRGGGSGVGKSKNQTGSGSTTTAGTTTSATTPAATTPESTTTASGGNGRDGSSGKANGQG